MIAVIFEVEPAAGQRDVYLAEVHHIAQAHGQAGIFSAYRLRVAAVLRDYGLAERDEAPADSRALHPPRARV